MLNVKEHVVGLPENVTSSFVATNAYRIKCEPTGYNQSYNLCQHIVNAKRTGKLDSMKSCAACSDALSKVECPAIHMMVAEKKAGRVLYYEHFAPSEQRYPEKPVREVSEISRSWFNKDMLIPTTVVVEKAEKQNGIMTISTNEQVTTNPMPQPTKPNTKVAPASLDNIYESAMMDAFRNENTHNAIS